MSNSQSKTQASCLAALLVTLAFAATDASALPTINLTAADYTGTDGNLVTAHSSGTMTNALGSVIFQRDTTQPAGTGVFNPFLRLDVKGNVHDEQGYNTSATRTTGNPNNLTTRNILDNLMPVNWTHDVLISSLQLVTLGNQDYYQFKLDINEPGANKNDHSKSLLSLDGLKLYSTSDPSQSGIALNTTTKDILDTEPGGVNGTLLWDMDYGKTFNTTGPTNIDPNDRSVLLDAKAFGGPGSGMGDMMMLVEKAVIDKAGSQTHLVLWSRFGLTQGADTSSTTADAGFEEWAYSGKTSNGNCTNCPGTGTGVPAPGTAYLAFLALGLLGYQRSQAHKSSSAFALAA